jgi:hypothetical protein
MEMSAVNSSAISVVSDLLLLCPFLPLEWHSTIEVPLAHSLLTDEKLIDLIDVFYLEHHVYMEPVWNNWKLHKENVHGTIEQSLKLFIDMRKKGIASHSWP